MWYTDICPPYIRISTKHNGPYKGFIRASNTNPGPPTREHKSLLNNAIRLDGVVFVVRRIGMTKPPVKLGVGKKFLEKRKEPPSDRMKLVWQPQHFNIGGSMSMNDVKSGL